MCVPVNGAEMIDALAARILSSFAKCYVDRWLFNTLNALVTLKAASKSLRKSALKNWFPQAFVLYWTEMQEGEDLMWWRCPLGGLSLYMQHTVLYVMKFNLQDRIKMENVCGHIFPALTSPRGTGYLTLKGSSTVFKPWCVNHSYLSKGQSLLWKSKILFVYPEKSHVEISWELSCWRSFGTLESGCQRGFVSKVTAEHLAVFNYVEQCRQISVWDSSWSDTCASW